MNFRDISKRKNSVLGREASAPRVTLTRQIEFPSNAQPSGLANPGATLPQMRLKICSKCHTEQPAAPEFFPPRKESRDGFDSWCRACHRAAGARYRAAHLDATCAACARWRAMHPEAARAAGARYRAAHPKVVRANKARWYKVHPKAAKAHHAASWAVQSGRLTCPDICERCGKSTHSFDKHHPDYARPLDVVFLCRSCHKKVHVAGSHGCGRHPMTPRKKLSQATLRKKIAAVKVANEEWIRRQSGERNERKIAHFRYLARRAAAQADTVWYAAVERLYRAMQGGAGVRASACPPAPGTTPPANAMLAERAKDA